MVKTAKNWKAEITENWLTLHRGAKPEARVLKLPADFPIDCIIFGYFDNVRGQFVWHCRLASSEETINEIVPINRLTDEIPRQAQVEAITRLITAALTKTAQGIAERIY